MLFHVYDAPKPEGYYINEPQGFYRTMLDADWVMYILLPGLLIAIVVALIYAWRLHEIPKHKAEHKKMRQAELVSALTVLGLFEHWVWVVALFIAYMDWDAVDDWVLSIVRRSRDALMPSPTANAEPVVTIVEPKAPVDVVVSEIAVVETTPVSTNGNEEPRP
jgi:hypothetical protein